MILKYKSSIYFFSNYNISPGLFLQKASIPPAARDLAPLAGKKHYSSQISPLSFSHRHNLSFDVPLVSIWLGTSCRILCIFATRGSLRVLSSCAASSFSDLYSFSCRWGTLSRCRFRSSCSLPPSFPPVYAPCGLFLRGSS